ncbi:MAG: hypothetical protein ACKV0T_17555 [Planctomycetales bacterium]
MPQSSSSHAESAANARQVLGAIQGEIEPVPVSLVYRAGLALVALGMILIFNPPPGG